MAARISLCVPVLLAADLPRLIAFFTENLGFTTDFTHGDPIIYAGVSRDNACLHLATTGLPNTSNLAAWKPDNQPADVCFFVPDVDALHQEFASRGVHSVAPPETQSYGIRDIDILTPDGHVLRFNQVLSHHPHPA